MRLKKLFETFVWHDDDMAGGGEPFAVTTFSHREATGALSQRCGLGTGEGTWRGSRRFVDIHDPEEKECDQLSDDGLVNLDIDVGDSVLRYPPILSRHVLWKGLIERSYDG